MRVIVCGGRVFNDSAKLNQVLNALHFEHGITEVIAGGAAGADTLAVRWAEGKGIPATVIMADWARYGKRAGWLRNNKMADENPDAVIAFPGGRGTAMMIEIANSRGIMLYNFTYI